MIVGASGTGKSGLAMQLLDRGAVLVADDRVILTQTDDQITATCPPAIRGRIEARGVGLLAVRPQPNTTVRLVVDLGQTEPDRLPPLRTITLLGVEIDLVFGKDTPNLAVALKLRANGGRLD